MARITVEDCLEKENNRFALVQLAAKRTKQILGGSKPLVSSNNKSVVVSLREIAEAKVRFMTEEELAAKREKEAQESKTLFEQPIVAAPSPNIEQLLASSDDGEDENVSEDELEAELDDETVAKEEGEEDVLNDSERNGSHE